MGYDCVGYDCVGYDWVGYDWVVMTVWVMTGELCMCRLLLFLKRDLECWCIQGNVSLEIYNISL